MPEIDTALERVPGKVVAVHSSYRSRAAERGTMPSWPSYFLKPASSLAASGDPVARPPGCELLAFEGEVALVIGRRARRVGSARARNTRSTSPIIGNHLVSCQAPSRNCGARAAAMVGARLAG